MPDQKTRKTIVVDRGNAHIFWKVMNELSEGRSEIEKMLHRYPLELSADGFYRFVMKIGEIDEIIADIDKALALYRRQKPKHRRPCDMKCFKVEKFVVSSRNLESVKGFIVALQGKRDMIIDMMRKYPLHVMAYGIHFLFSDVREVDWVIGSLKRKVRDAEANAGKMWWENLLALGA